MLNYRLLAACIGIILGSILYFFYWNRFIAFLLGVAFRVSLWNQKASDIWLEIGSIHFSLLAGRILLKDVRYHSSNQTVKIVKAQIVWRYWIRKPTTEEDLNHARVGGEGHKYSRDSQSCRIHVSFQGFEWYMYNRTAAYDNIASAVDPGVSASRPESRHQSEDATEPRRVNTKSSGFAASSVQPSSFVSGAPRLFRSAYTWLKQQLPSLDPKDLLPIGIEATEGAIVCGNGSTPSLLVAEFKKAEGTFGIVQARSKLDFYKQILSLRFENTLIQYVENEEFQNPMTATGRLVQDHIEASRYYALPRLSYLSYRNFTKLWRRLKLYTLIPHKRTRFSGSPPSTLRIGKRSHKSLDEETPIGASSATSEYAIERKLLETPVLEVSYYADVVGQVSTEHSGGTAGLESFDIGNGDLPPEWGVDIVVHGGFFRYGPWADRQRVELQRTFFPSAYHDIAATSQLHPGDQRLWTSLKVFVELRDQTTLHLPFRETSKNWQWDGQVDVPRPKKREPALIHVVTGDNSSISYILPMVVGSKGYEPLLEVHLDTIAITSSLNDIRLLTAETCSIRGAMPSPLQWNGERRWTFTVLFRHPVIYILRDHINMFTDLGKDWVSGPPVDYHRFIPMVYAFELEMDHFELNAYVNDQNVIDKPLVRDENAIFTVQGPRFRHEAQISSNVYRPEAIIIPFFIEAPDLFFVLSPPRWNTHSSNYGNRIGKIGFFNLDASYRFSTEVHEENVDQFKLEITVRDMVFKALGWAIRYFMVMRDNYLGSYTNFSTLNEYLEKRKKGLPPGDPLELRYREGRANIMQVEIGVFIEHSQILLPAGLPGYETTDPAQDPTPSHQGVGACVVVAMPELQLHFRLHDYYMEMSLNLDTISGSIEDECSERLFLGPRYRSMKENFVVDGIDITANRMFGPQPRTSTYFCMWEICLGHVKAALSASEWRVITAAGNAFRLNFVDMENAPAAQYTLPIDPDVTFLKLSLTGFDATWIAGHAALEMILSHGLTLQVNDLAGKLHRKVTSLRIPRIHLKVLITAPGRQSWLEAAHFSSDASFDMYSAPAGWRKSAHAQADFVRTQDILTGRAKFMFRTSAFGGSDAGGLHKNGLYLPRPRLFDHAPRKTEVYRDDAFNEQMRWSDSDGDENVLEADRDARLAQSRVLMPLSPSRSDPDEQSMSSGDESDNEDLTDAETSDSDWFDSDGLEGDEKFALGQYHRVTNHYASRSLNTPSLWEGSPFVLTHNFACSSTSRKRRRTDSWRQLPPLGLVEADKSDEETDTVTLRFQCLSGIDIRITPLIAPAAAKLDEDISATYLSAELALDTMTAKFLSDFSGGKTFKQRMTVFDIHLSSVNVQIVQRVTSLEENSAAASFQPEIAKASCLDTLAKIDFQSDEWHVMGKTVGHDLVNSELTVAATVNTMSLSLDTISTKSDSQSGPHGGVQIQLSDFQGTFTKDKADVAIGGLSVDFSHSSPNIAVSIALALAHTAKNLSRTHERWCLRDSMSMRKLLYHILSTSVDKFIVDPYSTIQPSYLVQSGRPNKLRTDAILRLLHHLRRCLQEMDAHERQAFFSDAATLETDAALGRILPLLESRLVNLASDADTSNALNIATLERLYPSLRMTSQSETTGRGIPFTSGSFSIGKFDLIVRDCDGKSNSQVSMASLVIAIRIRAQKLLPLNTVTSAILSQTSLRDRSHCDVRQIFASIGVGDVYLTVLPHLMRFAQQVLRVHRRYRALQSKDRTTPEVDTKSNKVSKQAIHFILTLSLQLLRLEAAAEKLISVFGIAGLQIGSAIFAKSGLSDHSMNHSILFQQMFLRARSNVGTSQRSDSDILASLVFSGCKCNTVVRQEPLSSIIVRQALFLEKLQLEVPRSAIRLYRFVEEWRADFLPDIEATLHALLSEIDRAPMKPISSIPSRPNQKKLPILHLHAHVSSLGVSLQVMHGTWLSWDVHHIVTYLKPSTVTTRDSSQSFGLQLASQIFSISYRPNLSVSMAPDTRVKLELPTLSLTGRSSESSLYILACIDFFDLIVKPSHWDTLLTVQQKFGQDFNDLVNLVEETRRKNATPSQKSSVASASLKYSGFLKMRGFRIGLKGISSTLFLECDDIGGGIDNDFGCAWNIGLSGLALSLAPRASSIARKSGFNRNHRSAFVIIDFEASAGRRNAPDTGAKTLCISVAKIHAVMQPSSIGEVGDFIDHLQAEMLDRKKKRAAELAEFKEKTKSVLRSFEVKVKDVEPEEKTAWLSDHTINLTVGNIGVAFPLTLDQGLELPQTGSHDSTSVRAFLFSIRSLVFGAQRGETGQAVMKGFSFQFVSRFRQSVPADFSGAGHQTRNRLVYPEMTAQVRSETSASSRKISILANVSGFVLDIDSSIPDDIFSLIDVYRQGQERVARLADNIPRNTPITDSSLISPESTATQYPVLLTSSVVGSLTFLSGKVHVYSGSASSNSRTRSLSTAVREPTDEQFLEFGADIFKLPVVSVWVEYRATPAAQKFGIIRKIEPSTLMFKSTIHSSQNTLRSTLLPFLTETVQRIEIRMRKNLGIPHKPSVIQDTASRIVSDRSEPAFDAVSSMQISFSLRIDQSRLELTCQPDVNVLAGLHWDNGGFVVNVSPGARDVTFTGSVAGLTVGLKHGFLSDECVRLNARNLAFSMQIAKKTAEDGELVSLVSVILDTQFEGGVRFSRLQDILCFKAVWLDRIPVFSGQQIPLPQTPSEVAPHPTPSSLPPKQEIATAVLIRIRDIKLDVDLGQSISAISLNLQDALIRTKMTEDLYEVSLSVANVAILAKGNISGRVTVPDCLFRTIRRKEHKLLEGEGKTKMLELIMTSGPLDAVLESDHQKLLQYHADPLEVNIFDDWPSVSKVQDHAEEQPLRLSFTVSGTEVIAAVTVGTIPKLLSYANKFAVNMDVQRAGASRESNIFRDAQSPKPDNPLSDVANAMFHSARDRFRDAATELSYVIEQHMSLRLDSLRLVVFPRAMTDMEMAQFVGSDVHARLDRKAGSDGLLAKRILHLSFSSMSISKYSQLNHSLSATAESSDGRSWLTLLLKGAPEAIIVGLPSMNMMMSSEESVMTDAKELFYDFNSSFVRRDGMQNVEDIYITLNMSLYSWLTLLRKNLSREMGQIQASSDWRTGSVILPPVIASRKRVPEPVGVKEEPTDVLLPQKSPSPTASPALCYPRSASSSSTDPLTLSLSGEPGSESPEPGTSPVIPPLIPGGSIPAPSISKTSGIVYKPGDRHIERLNMRQLGEATPDVMHPFFMKKAGFNLEDSLPQYVHEYASIPIEQIMQGLLRLYSKQLRTDKEAGRNEGL